MHMLITLLTTLLWLRKEIASTDLEKTSNTKQIRSLIKNHVPKGPKNMGAPFSEESLVSQDHKNETKKTEIAKVLVVAAKSYIKTVLLITVRGTQTCVLGFYKPHVVLQYLISDK